MAPRYDVAVIGAGIAGLAAAVFLRQAGMDVVCFDARPYPHHKVGESLDWSSPGLLARVGIDADALLADGIATFKRKIVVCEVGRDAWTAAPPPQIRHWPMRFETATLHVDRAALDNRLFEHARSLGTTFVWERVTGLQVADDRIRSCATSGGRRVDARWYIDASGTSRFFARKMGIPVRFYGQPKVCLWTYYDTAPLHDGTTFFVDNSDEYLRWIWDIPISPGQTSVGFVLSASEMRDRRRAGESVPDILRAELARHQRFAAFLSEVAAPRIESTAFQPYVVAKVCGANWLMVGEAASMPDPLTGNGVTSGIRHARHAAAAIRGAGDQLSPRRRQVYGCHVSRLGHSFNAYIEQVIYRQGLRRALGLRAATYIYTLFAFFMNALHARCDPRGRFGMTMFQLLFLGARTWIAGWTLAARGVLEYRRWALAERQR
jgi:flavin-dependent dehydrogenase